MLQKLQTFDQVVICYVQSGAKVPLDWLVPLAESLQSGRLLIERMPLVAKNAADFGLCFHAGRLMQALPTNANFTIASNDADLDHVVQLLQAHGRQAQRKGSPTPTGKASNPPTSSEGGLPFAAPSLGLTAGPAERPHIDATPPPAPPAVAANASKPGTAASPGPVGLSTAKITQRLSAAFANWASHAATRPRSRASLTNSLRSHLGQDSRLAEVAVAHMFRLGLVKQTGESEALVYDSAKLSQSAKAG